MGVLIVSIDRSRNLYKNPFIISDDNTVSLEKPT